MLRHLLPALLCATFALPVCAADWPHWRGPNYNGIAPDSPPLVDEFPATGPKKLWESQDGITCGPVGGYSSPIVADGKVFAHSHEIIPHAWRMITKDVLTRQGYYPTMPPDLAKKVEAARLLPERIKLGGSSGLWPWMDNWIKANLPPDQAQFEDSVRARLRLGEAAVPLDLLDKVVPIIDRKFETTNDWKDWLKNSGLDEESQDALRQLPAAKDTTETLFCLDAATGKTLWKTTIPSEECTYVDSSSPTVSKGKIYLINSTCTLCCFDESTGKLLWQSPFLGKFANPHGRGSSPFVTNDRAYAATVIGISCISLDTHHVLWTVPTPDLEVATSPIVWSTNGKSVVLFEEPGRLMMLEPDTGKTIATAKGGTNGTPAIVGDRAVALQGAVNVVAYQLEPEKISLLWSSDFPHELYASGIIAGDYAYFFGGGDHYARSDGGKPGKAMCFDLKTGKTQWEQELRFAEMTSPILADNKIIYPAYPDILLIKPTPDKFQLLAKADLNLVKWVSPALADGKLYVRTATKVVCYDLAK